MTNVVKKVSINGQVVPFGGGGSGEANETVYLTQAEYDVLTPDEHTDYVIYDTNTSPIGIDAESVSFDNTQTTMQSDNVQDAIEEVFQSVSNGKELLADAITDKGVQTSANDSFSTMATNIGLIQTASDYDAFITKTYIKNNFFRNESWYGISTSLTWDFLNSDKSKYYRYFVVTSSLSSWARYHLWLATKTENDDFVVTVWDSFLSADSVIDIYENRKKIVWNDVSYSLFFWIRNVHQSPVYETYYYITATNTTVWTPVNMWNSTYTTYESAYEQRDTNCWISSAENIADINRTTLSTAVSSNYYYNLTINVL